MSKMIKVIYLYFFSFLGLILIVIGGVRLSDTILKTFIFKEANNRNYDYASPPVIKDTDCEFTDQEIRQIKTEYDAWHNRPKVDYDKQQRARDMSISIAFLIVGFPLYIIHRRAIKRS